MDQGQMLLIVILVGALLWMFFKNHKGGVCSLMGGNRETYVVGANLFDDARSRVSSFADRVQGAASDAYEDVTDAVGGAAGRAKEEIKRAGAAVSAEATAALKQGGQFLIDGLAEHYKPQHTALCKAMDKGCGTYRPKEAGTLCGNELINRICRPSGECRTNGNTNA